MIDILRANDLELSEIILIPRAVQTGPAAKNLHSPQGGNETEIMLRARYSGYGGMKIDPKVVEKR